MRIIIRDIFAILKRINQEDKTTILIAEQNAAAALAIADYGYVLQNGKTTSEGPAKSLMERQLVRSGYLGLNEKGTFVSHHYAGSPITSHEDSAG